MIKDAEQKFKDGALSFEFGPDDTIIVVERQFHPGTGVPEMLPVQTTSVTHIEDLEKDNAIQMAPYQQLAKDLAFLKGKVEEKTIERQKIAEKKSKEKVK